MPQLFNPNVMILKEAFSTHVGALTRYWIAAATVSFLVMFGSEAGPIDLFGFKLGADQFYPAAAILGSIANFAYCISHIQAYEAMKVFRGYVSGLADADLVPGMKSVNDASYLLLPSAPNRVYPIARVLRDKFGASIANFVEKVVKFPVDFFVVGVPVFGFFQSANWILTKPINPYHVPIISIVLASLVASTALLIEITQWKWQKFQKKFTNHNPRS